MTEGALTLYGSATARTLRTLWLAHEMELEFTHVPARPRTGDLMTPEFLGLSPRHKVPIIRHGDLVLTESAAILIYLTETFPSPPHIFRAADRAEQARHLEWCFFIMSELDANGLYTMRRHGALKSIYGDAPVAVEEGAKYTRYQLDRMEESLRAMDPFLMGAALSPADILLVSCLDWAVGYEIALPDYLMDYRAGMNARPAYQTAKAQNEGGA
jgi:glutathione S-transferase